MLKVSRQHLTRAYQNLRRQLARFHREKDGTTGIEFAFVGLPFLLLLFAIFEVSLVFMADINILHATADSARKVRTLQSGVNTVQKFKEDVCGKVIFIPNCISKLQVEVKAYNDFDSINNEDPLTEDGDLKDSFIFNIGGPGSVITIRTFLVWDIFASIPDIGLGNMPNGNRLIQGFAAFRNES